MKEVLPVNKVSLVTIMSKSSDKSSLSLDAQSLASRKLKSVANAVKKGVKAIAKPLKKARQALSARSSRSSIRSNATSDGDELAVIDVDDDDDIEEEVDPEKQLEGLKRTWRSPIYTFFKVDKASVQYHDSRLTHFFPCAARKCKTTLGGVRRFQDSKDRSSTANLRHHALKCFGEDAVKGFAGNTTGQSASIFALFARKGQQPVQYSHRSHTNPEVRYVISHIVIYYLFIKLQCTHCQVGHRK